MVSYIKAPIAQNLLIQISRHSARSIVNKKAMAFKMPFQLI